MSTETVTTAVTVKITIWDHGASSDLNVRTRHFLRRWSDKALSSQRRLTVARTPDSGYEARGPSNPPDAEDWSHYKDIILKMYDEDDRPLSEVRLFMETCYGFAAR